MSSLIFPGTNRSGDCGPQLDVLENVLEEAWDKLEQFENKKRSNLIFYGVRGENRETQADLIQKVCKTRPGVQKCQAQGQVFCP